MIEEVTVPVKIKLVESMRSGSGGTSASSIQREGLQATEKEVEQNKTELTKATMLNESYLFPVPETKEKSSGEIELNQPGKVTKLQVGLEKGTEIVATSSITELPSEIIPTIVSGEVSKGK